MVDTWYDNSGVLRKYGITKAIPNIAGEYKTNGALREIEIKLDLTTVGSSSAIICDQVFFPKMRIEEIAVVTQTLAVGVNAVLNIGLVREDRTTTYDADGFIAAIPTTSMDAAGEKTTLNVGSTYAGAFIGTTLANTGYLVADYDTAAFTAGVIYIRIRFTAQ